MSEKFSAEGGSASGGDFKQLDLSKEPDQKKFDEEFQSLSEKERSDVAGAMQEIQ